MKKSIFIAIIALVYSSSFGQYSKNNLTLKPFNANNIGLGIGFHYERYIDSSQNLSLVIPFNYSFEIANSNKYGGNINDNSFGIDINPGIRFYFVEPRNFNWYIGSSFIFGYENVDIKDLNNTVLNNYSRNIFGSLINVGFKGTIKQKFTYNVEFGNGLKFIDKISSTSNIIYPNPNSRYMASIMAGFGYNF